MVEIDVTVDDLVRWWGEGKRIACFGAGAGLQIFDKMLESVGYGLIWKVVDNDSNKQGKFLDLAFGKYEVVSPNQIMDTDCVVVTCIAYSEIKHQIQHMPFQKDVTVCCYKSILEKFMVDGIRLRSWEFRVSKQSLIPKVIHYCWFGKSEIPAQYRRWMESWEKHCPGYDIVRWDETNYDVRKNRYMKDAYQSGNYGFVSDYARLDIVYEHGGIYLDVDVELIKPLDDFLYEKGFAAFHYNRVSTGLGFGAIRHLPIIQKLRDDYERQRYIHFSTNEERREKKMRICPDIQTDFLMGLGLVPNGFIFQEVEELRIYPMPVLCGIEGEVLDASYSIHHFEGSWLKGLESGRRIKD